MFLKILLWLLQKAKAKRWMSKEWWRAMKPHITEIVADVQREPMDIVSSDEDGSEEDDEGDSEEDSEEDSEKNSEGDSEDDLFG